MLENSHQYRVCPLFLKFLKMLIVFCIVSKSNPDRVPGPQKNGPYGKGRPQGLKRLSFFSSNMKVNVEVLHFHMKSRGVHGLLFAQKTFENFTLNFYFESSEIGKKRWLPICSPYYHGTFLYVYSFSCSLVLNKKVFLWN